MKHSTTHSKWLITTLLLVLSFLSVNAQNQQCTVKGWVVDDSHSPLQYATVMVNAGNNTVASTLTNAEGAFSVEVAKSETPY